MREEEIVKHDRSSIQHFYGSRRNRRDDDFGMRTNGVDSLEFVH